MAKPRWKPATAAVHAGETIDPTTGDVVAPIHQTSTFTYPETPTPAGGWRPSNYFYSRFANPTITAVEEKLAALEGAPAALGFSSGMGAVAAALFSHCRPGQRVAAMLGLYGGTRVLLSTEVERLGIAVDSTPSLDAADLADACKDETRVVLLEAPTNPFNRLMDIPELRRRLEERFGRGRPRIVVDSTFATPINLRPLDKGADVVVHSATKYLNGHSDLIAGFAAASRADVDRMEPWRRSVGAILDPHQAWLVNRGLKTLHLRVDRAQRNATQVARELDSHRLIERVWHLSLDSHPEHKLSRRLMKGPGAIVSFQLRTRRVAAARRFLRSLRVFAPAVSLGGVESLASIPFETSHKSVDPAERRSQGITPTLVRLAVGIEDVDDLVQDLRAALRAV